MTYLVFARSLLHLNSDFNLSMHKHDDLRSALEDAEAWKENAEVLEVYIKVVNEFNTCYQWVRS